MSERLVSPAQVGVVMGSDSDWVVMADAAQVLRDFGVPARGRRGVRPPDARGHDRVRAGRPPSAG